MILIFLILLNYYDWCNIVFKGDERVNQHPDMAVSTISLLRLHNVLCDELKRINPSWDDERLYQKAKSLLIAMYQHVTYNEFVPILVGRSTPNIRKLIIKRNKSTKTWIVGDREHVFCFLRHKRRLKSV